MGFFYGLYMGHIPSDPSQRRLHLQGDLLARRRGVGRRGFDRCGARRFGAAGEEVFSLGDGEKKGGYEQLTLAIWVNIWIIQSTSS